ncbi:LCP family protein [Cellulomonas fimi]|uniref:LCP family protein n=1 Tax=Cellulomonas fimi TaxID=1708 RepID=UPI0028934206|nr:LCP family protein [Cellulomonas fimi]
MSRPPEHVPAPAPRPETAGRPRRRGRRAAGVLAFVLVLLLAWPIGLLIWASGKIQHVEALTTAPGTAGTTYLLAGSDSRADGVIEDAETLGARTDTIMLLQVPSRGPAALISLPRDTFVDIPGQGPGKLNASFSLGGAPLLVQTVEQLTGLRVDHYVEIGFGGVQHVVDAVGGVELCLEDPNIAYPVDDQDSGLVWPAPGCQVVDGFTALAFARMRQSDPTGDIGRGLRQQQLIGAVTSAVSTPSLALQPTKQVALVDTGLGALAVSEGSGILDLGRLALGFRAATGPEGIRGTPPILDTNYRPGGVGSTVRLDPDATPAFFADLAEGALPPGTVGGMPGS